jgi:hypothetical protein
MDISASMGPLGYNYLPIAVSSASQFVYIMNARDQLGVSTFSTNAAIAYPAGGNAVTPITGNVQNDAKNALSGLQAFGPSTNISAGLTTSASMLTSAAAPKAIILLSDGQWNAGPDPRTTLPSVPVYTIGLGPASDPATLQAISSGTGGQWHSAGTIDQLFDVYNEIIGQTMVATVAANQQQSVDQYRFWTLPGNVTAGSSAATFALSWSNPAVTWTSGVPTGNQVSGALRDPTGASQPMTVYASGAGYVVLRIPNPVAGIWNLTLVSAVPGMLATTQAIFTPVSGLNMTAQVEQRVCVGEAVHVPVQVLDSAGAPIEDSVITAVLERPLLHPQQVVDMHRERLDALDLPGEDGELSDNQKLIALQAQLGSAETLLPYQHLPLETNQSANGGCDCGFTPETQGAHILRLTATGRNEAGPFSLSRRISVWAGD